MSRPLAHGRDVYKHGANGVDQLLQDKLYVARSVWSHGSRNVRIQEEPITQPRWAKSSKLSPATLKVCPMHGLFCSVCNPTIYAAGMHVSYMIQLQLQELDAKRHAASQTVDRRPLFSAYIFRNSITGIYRMIFHVQRAESAMQQEDTLAARANANFILVGLRVH